MRDFPVLTSRAVKITPTGAHGKDSCPWVKVIKRFFLNRIDAGSRGESVNQRVERTAPVQARMSRPALTVRDNTPNEADVAPNLVLGQLFV